ncbi:MAG: sigma-70 family RNA polymerase sigma factor [Chitinophagaceae bacterium]
MEYVLNPEKWADNYADYLLRFAMMRINQLELAQDLVQETFFSAIKSKQQFKGNSSEKTWLTSILKNKIIDEYRKKGRKNYIEEQELYEDNSFLFFKNTEGEIGQWKENELPQAWEKNALDKIEEKEYYQVLRQCVEKLNPTQQGLLQEKYFEENSTEKICKEFNISKSNYWVILHRINLLLRKCIELNWFKK